MTTTTDNADRSTTDTTAGKPSGSGWYRGKFGQWRRSARVPLLWDRQGIHALLGALVAAMLFWGGDYRFAVASGSLTALFIAYEVAEGWRIKDWAWVDIAGYIKGFAPVSVAAFVAARWPF